MTTKVHALVDALGNPCNLMLTPGQDHDLTCAQPLLENADPRALIGDKAYDADSLINALDRRAITAVIPPKANRKVKRDCDFALYCERNLVERFFNKIKHYRAIATRYDKLAQNFLAAVQLVEEGFPAAEARRLVERFEWHYTPKHGSWLNMAESELGVLASQCLNRRIADKQILAHEVNAWQDYRNKHHAKANWQFKTADARVKLKRLYPQFG